MQFILKVLFLLLLSFVVDTSSAQAASTQEIQLKSGWNIVSTPMILDSHSFSAPEASDNFDIFVLDASSPSGWSTMAAIGQTEFTPLFGYFINNKTAQNQVLTLTYKENLNPLDKLFERDFNTPGWYSIGVANDQYAKDQSADTVDTNNPNRVLSLLEGKYDLVVDFTNAPYASNRRSVALSDPWKAAIPSDLNQLNDFRETKGYAIYIKGAGASYTGFQNDPVADIVNEDIADELVIKTSTSDPDSTTLQVDYDAKSDYYTVFAFNLDSDDSDDNLIVKSLPIRISLGGGIFSQLIDDAELYIEGETYGDYIVSDTESNNPTLTFDLGEGANVYVGELQTVEFRLRFKAMPPELQLATVSASVVSDDGIVAESTEVLASEQIMGVATGNTHTLMTSGIIANVESVDADVTINDGNANDYATYVIEVDVTAFEQDAYISTTPGTSFNYTLENGASVAAVAGSQTVTVTSTGDEQGAYFLVNEGETETFTVTVTYVPGVANTAARMQLDSIEFAATAVAPNQIWTASPEEYYRTAVVTIVN